MERYLVLKINNSICFNMNDPGKTYAKFKKPVMKYHIFYDTIYMQCRE